MREFGKLVHELMAKIAQEYTTTHREQLKELLRSSVAQAFERAVQETAIAITREEVEKAMGEGLRG